VANGPQRVESGEFSVTRVRHSISTVARGESLPTGLVQVTMGSISSGPTSYYYKTEFSLHSDAQPNVLRMTCQSNQNDATIQALFDGGGNPVGLGERFHAESAL
jgi:hypothetical protein